MMDFAMFSSWDTKIMNGEWDEPYQGWNHDLREASITYRGRTYARNAHGFMLRKDGESTNMLHYMPPKARDAFLAMCRRLVATYLSKHGIESHQVEGVKVAASSSHTNTREIALPHLDHGASIVIAYFAEASLDDETDPNAGSFIAFNSKFPQAFGLHQSQPHMRIIKPKVGTFVVYTPDTIHMHSPTFFEKSSRCVIDAFVDFRMKNRKPRSDSAIEINLQE